MVLILKYSWVSCIISPLDCFSWFSYLVSLLYSGDFPHVFPDPWWSFLLNNKAFNFWWDALWSLVLAISIPQFCEIGLNPGQSLGPQISTQGGQSLEFFTFSRKKFSTLLHETWHWFLINCVLRGKGLGMSLSCLQWVNNYSYVQLCTSSFLYYVPHIPLIFIFIYSISVTKPLSLHLSAPGDRVLDHLYSVYVDGRGKLKVVGLDFQLFVSLLHPCPTSVFFFLDNFLTSSVSNVSKSCALLGFQSHRN